MDLEKCSLIELKQLAEKAGIENISKLKRKADLIEALKNVEESNVETKLEDINIVTNTTNANFSNSSTVNPSLK